MELKVSLVHKFFTEEEKKLWFELRDNLTKTGIKILTPEPKIADIINAGEILQKEYDAVKECDFVIIWTDSLDSGANFMWGMSFAMKKEIITFSRGKSTTKHPIFELTTIRHFSTELDLIIFLVEQNRIKNGLEIIQEDDGR